MTGRLRSVLLTTQLVALAAIGCKQPQHQQPPAATPAPARVEAPPPTPEPPPTQAPPPEAPSNTPKLGWSEVSRRDDLPICVFSSFDEREAALVFPKAKKQTLRADAPLVFGVYEPWCLNEACDERTLLQCWVERAENTLTVHTRFASQRKDGASCAEGCTKVETSCESPLLEAGDYTIRHGDKTYPLKIPSVVRAPCFEAKQHPSAKK